ncbi:uncharacterized protein B0H18DRAFT_1212370, partial [Fomitopsis serialis]|uniref:uncharacterized protein n=1 Tax=Fomitopsis serialis TaxID=139415 RepID=UPI0020089208
MLPELPVELHEQILEHLQDERSLRMCCLTCRGWAFFAQPTFSASIDRRNRIHVRELSLVGLGFAANGIPTPRLQRIIRLLVNIETLSIDDDWYSRPTFIVDYSRIATHSLSDAVAVLFPAPTLKTLRLSKVSSSRPMIYFICSPPFLPVQCPTGE